MSCPQKPAGDCHPGFTCRPCRSPQSRERAPSSLLLLCQHSCVLTKLAQVQTPTSNSVPGRKSVFTGKAPLSAWGEFSENTGKLSPSLRYPDDMTAWSLSSHLHGPGSYSPHPPALSVAAKTAPWMAHSREGIKERERGGIAQVHSLRLHLYSCPAHRLTSTINQIPYIRVNIPYLFFLYNLLHSVL